MAEIRPATEVPEALKRMVRFVLDGFYTPECNYVMELLVHHPCIKEDDLAQLTKFDKKQLRASLNALKMDQFIGCRMQMETGEDKKVLKHNYYFIRYTLFINVVKYKLHCMREKIEAKEKEAIYRDTFKCPVCLKTFNDLDAGDLFDQASGTFKCTLCSSVVEEQLPDKDEDCTNLMAVFNEEMKPIYDCLEEIDNITLSDLILNPIPIKDLPSRTAKRSHPGKTASQEDNSESWGGDISSKISFKNSSSERHASKKRNKDGSLAWMKHNTIESTFTQHEKSDATTDQSKSSSMKQTMAIEMTQPQESTPHNNQDILKTLMFHEKGATLPQTATLPTFHAPSHASDSLGKHESSQVENEDGEEEEEDDEDAGDYYVSIGGTATPYNSITAEMVLRMSEEEKEEYIRVGREMHEYFD